MKFTLITTATLVTWLTVSPCAADEKADASSKTQASETVAHKSHAEASSEATGSATTETGKKTGEVMFGQMMAIQAQLGLHRGSAEETREMRANAHTQAEALAAEAKTVLGADATPQEIREFFHARTAGYSTVAEMNQDITVVLGSNPTHGAVRTYLLLRRAEMEGLSGRASDFAALKAEIKALGDVNVVELRGFLREKVRASIGRDDADEKGEDADVPDSKKSEAPKDEHSLLHVGLKAEHHESQEASQEGQAEARQERLEANVEAKIEAKINELEANTEAKLSALEAQQEKVNAKIETKRDEVQQKAEARKEEIEAKRQKIEVKVKAQQKIGLGIGGSDASDDQH